MSGLAEAVAFLKRMPRGEAAKPRTAAQRRSEHVQRFGANPGALTMWAYVPKGLPVGAPLVVALHGCTQDAEAHAASGGWLQLADRLGFAVLMPEQTPANNRNRCFNWFQTQDTARGHGEAASIAAMIDHAVRAHGLDGERVYITGLSAGGAMAAAMLAAYPELFAGGAIIGGLPCGVASNLQEALALMRTGPALPADELAGRIRRAAPAARRPVRLSVWHGDADVVVCPANGRAGARQWVAALGLPDQPLVASEARWVRETWTDGRSSVEFVNVRGLGHGTPLATGGEAGLGFAAPFMLECGLSSTLETATFWGLEPAPGYVPVVSPPGSAAESEAPQGADQGLAASVLGSTAPHVSPEVQGVIAKALKSAGLMR